MDPKNQIILEEFTSNNPQHNSITLKSKKNFCLSRPSSLFTPLPILFPEISLEVGGGDKESTEVTGSEERESMPDLQGTPNPNLGKQLEGLKNDVQSAESTASGVDQKVEEGARKLRGDLQNSAAELNTGVLMDDDDDKSDLEKRIQGLKTENSELRELIDTLSNQEQNEALIMELTKILKDEKDNREKLANEIANVMAEESVIRIVELERFLNLLREETEKLLSEQREELSEISNAELTKFIAEREKQDKEIIESLNSQIRDGIENMNKKIDELLQEFQTRLDKFKSETVNTLNENKVQIQENVTAINGLKERIKSLEPGGEKYQAMDEKIKQLQEKNQELKQKNDELENKTRQIEERQTNLQQQLTDYSSYSLGLDLKDFPSSCQSDFINYNMKLKLVQEKIKNTRDKLKENKDKKKIKDDFKQEIRPLYGECNKSFNKTINCLFRDIIDKAKDLKQLEEINKQLSDKDRLTNEELGSDINSVKSLLLTKFSEGAQDGGKSKKYNYNNNMNPLIGGDGNIDLIKQLQANQKQVKEDLERLLKDDPEKSDTTSAIEMEDEKEPASDEDIQALTSKIRKLNLEKSGTECEEFIEQANVLIEKAEKIQENFALDTNVNTVRRRIKSSFQSSYETLISNKNSCEREKRKKEAEKKKKAAEKEKEEQKKKEEREDKFKTLQLTNQAQQQQMNANQALERQKINAQQQQQQQAFQLKQQEQMRQQQLQQQQFQQQQQQMRQQQQLQQQQQNPQAQLTPQQREFIQQGEQKEREIIQAAKKQEQQEMKEFQQFKEAKKGDKSALDQIKSFVGMDDEEESLKDEGKKIEKDTLDMAVDFIEDIFSDENIKQQLSGEDIDKVDALIEQWQSVVQENKNLELLIDKQKETFTVNEGNYQKLIDDKNKQLKKLNEDLLTTQTQLKKFKRACETKIKAMSALEKQTDLEELKESREIFDIAIRDFNKKIENCKAQVKEVSKEKEEEMQDLYELFQNKPENVILSKISEKRRSRTPPLNRERPKSVKKEKKSKKKKEKTPQRKRPKTPQQKRQKTPQKKQRQRTPVKKRTPQRGKK